MTTALFLGVDGGGTKTEFVCIDGAGQVRARTLTGPTYHLDVGLQVVTERLEAGVGFVCAALDVDPGSFAGVFFGLPAYGEDRAVDPLLALACRRIMGHDRFRCGNDMICGWAGSLGGEDGINIVAGTGSIGYGEHAGRSARSGGWGELLGDEGSAHWIAMQGLVAFTRMSDGRDATGPLHARIGAALALTDDLDLCARLMGPPAMSRTEVAALARLVGAAAVEGDAAAADILARAGDHLADLALALRRTLGFTADQLAALSWSGSILATVEAVQRRFVARLEEAGGFRFVVPVNPPGEGAALYARRLASRHGW